MKRCLASLNNNEKEIAKPSDHCVSSEEAYCIRPMFAGERDPSQHFQKNPRQRQEQRPCQCHAEYSVHIYGTFFSLKNLHFSKNVIKNLYFSKKIRKIRKIRL
jgi:hypothetical protein